MARRGLEHEHLTGLTGMRLRNAGGCGFGAGRTSGRQLVYVAHHVVSYLYDLVLLT
jgi:hypothetical protein